MRKEIERYMHCIKCLNEKPDDISPQEYAYLSIGWTEKGIQVWCERHECNVCNIDFEGNQHPADIGSGEPILEIVDK